jgi:hypothetical protein
MTVKDYMLDLWCQLGADQYNFGQFTQTTLELTRCVHIDAAGIRAQSASAHESGIAIRHQSVLGKIVPCFTSQGHR